MTYDRLVCANCAGPVSEGRCPVCRANRARLQQSGPFAGLSLAAILTVVVLLVAAVTLIAVNQPA
ncbi:hypothetical protein [Streptomyces sp. NBC_01497]|uniref:hypothetical protein n=1 Tax=Streptomyces sp. NBC_01497 TaxID=2903885 RepID=UPI002E380DEC|nr:hypothetical protein [Streptomyces sp. NBC_01497]